MGYQFSGIFSKYQSLKLDAMLPLGRKSSIFLIRRLQLRLKISFSRRTAKTCKNCQIDGILPLSFIIIQTVVGAGEHVLIKCFILNSFSTFTIVQPRFESSIYQCNSMRWKWFPISSGRSWHTVANIIATNRRTARSCHTNNETFAVHASHAAFGTLPWLHIRHIMAYRTHNTSTFCMDTGSETIDRR